MMSATRLLPLLRACPRLHSCSYLALKSRPSFSTNPINLQIPDNDKSKSIQPHKKDGWASRFYKRYFDNVSKGQLRSSAYILSSFCTQAVKIDDFFDYFDMPDTYFSWFLVTELHIWMLSTRLMVGQTDEGKLMRNYLVEALWTDCHNRVKVLAEIPAGERKECILDIAEELQAALLVYDHGIVGDDKDLASALWRRFFLLGKPDGPRLELLVKYVRQTVVMLDEMPLNELIEKSRIKWLKLDDVNYS